MECRRGTGRFQWSTGGWFGAQVGSTCWMLACGLWFLGESRLFGALLLGCFAVANLVGTGIWAKRDKVDPYQAIQILLAVVLVFTTAAMVSADRLGLLGKLDQRVKNPRLLYLLLLLFPALMIMFRFQNRPKSPETGKRS
jgi:hypothetical protein